MKFRFNSFSRLILVFCITVQLPMGAQWLVPQPTSYLFSHGLFAGLQAKKYYPAYQPSVTDDVLAIKNDDFTVLNEPFSTFLYPEVRLNVKSGKKHEFGILKDFPGYGPMFGKLHDIIIARNAGISFTEVATGTPTLKNHMIDFSKINIGQGADISVLSDAYDEHVKRYPDHALVLFGASRGAGTIFNFLATVYAKKADKLVSIAVLDSCFDELSLDNLTSYLMERAPLGGSWLRTYLYGNLYAYLQRVTQFDPDGVAPIKIAHQFPKDIPVLLIASHKDSVVPIAFTQRVYQVLRDLGHEDVYLLELRKSRHCCGMIDDQRDKEMYQAVVQAFYNVYGVAHDPELAQQGMDILLNECQPG